MPTALNRCRGRTPLFIWAVGQEPTVVPIEAGFPIGLNHASGFLVETHYDNYDRRRFTDG